MRFDVITIFPEIFGSYVKESLIARARKKKLIKINTHNLRDFADDKRGAVDDRPFGGGFGMVLKVEPIFRAMKKIQIPVFFTGVKKTGRIKRRSKSKVVLFTPRGKKFTQKIAYKLSKLDQIIFICGRYEGVDERVARKIADVELSIGDYDLMGGELPAMVVIEAVSRLIPGVLGKKDLLKERITKGGGFIEYAQYTRPPKFFVKKPGRTRPEVWSVPKVLMSGNHKKINDWKKKHGKVIE